MNPLPQGNDLQPALMPREVLVNPSISSGGPRRFPAMVHIATLATFTLPILLLPYLLARRQLSLLHRRVDELGANVRVLQQDLNTILSEFAAQRDGHRRLKTSLYDLMQETNALQLQAEQKEAEQIVTDESIRNDLRRLLDETQHTRTQAALLRALGTSLADIAAFMHEIELEMGTLNQSKSQQSIEKLRLLALRMRSLPQQNPLSSELPTGQASDSLDR